MVRTLTFGKDSRSLVDCCYCKADEITSGGSHKLPEKFHQYPEIYQWIDNKLRVELRDCAQRNSRR
ncbi:phage/plasmid replication protein [Pseudomonas aeruginosa]|uniref:phage/plasmid replication domain-containing protein n=1 Tax=Pseudomonas aeruginosa TaxID=287 RepID=UPI00391F852B